MYTYIISGWYNNGSERKHFYEEVEARVSSEAMEMVIGRLAWKESLNNNPFYLELIHYE